MSHLALGGAERVALNLIESLRHDFEFSVCAVRGIGDGAVGESLHRELQSLAIPFHRGPRVPMRFGGMITGAFALARALRATQPDLLHLHTEIPEASYAALVAMQPRPRTIPLVRTIHNTVVWRFWRPLGVWCDRRMPHAAVAGVSPGAVTAFHELRRDSGAPPSPLPPEVIFNGVPPPPSWHAPARTTDEPIRVVFGGRFEPEKGTDLLPEILAHAPPPAGRRAHLDLFGSGAHRATLADLSRRPPPGWTLSVHRPVPGFARQLSRYDLILLPSRYEGLALVAIEAALAGMPAVITDAPGLRDVFPADHPFVARTADPASIGRVLRQALENAETAAAGGRLAQAFAQKHFALSTMAQRYRALYHRVLSP